jgi:hypothetical protein
VENVEKLSTIIVEKYASPRYINVAAVTLIYHYDRWCGKCGKVIHNHCGKVCIAMIYLSIVAIYGGKNVEKLSTIIVEKYALYSFT